MARKVSFCPWRFALSGVIAGACLAVAACGTSSSGEKPQGLAAPGDLRLSPTQLDSALREASTYEREFLSDGMLTFAEYESAILSAVRCEEAAGFTILAYPVPGKPGRPGPELTERGEYQYVQSAPETADRASLAAALERCERDYVGVVRRLWAEHTAPSAAEMQSARDAIARCLRDHRIPAPEHPSGGQLMSIAYPPSGIPTSAQPPEPYLGCALSVAESFGLPGYIGQ